MYGLVRLASASLPQSLAGLDAFWNEVHSSIAGQQRS
jgi:hypothetical protein